MAAKIQSWLPVFAVLFFVVASPRTVQSVHVQSVQDDDVQSVAEFAQIVDGLEYMYDRVIYVNDQNFNYVRTTYPRLTLNFGQDDCRMCDIFKPFYGETSKVVRRSQGDSEAWAFGIVDIKASPVLNSMFEINMYPLIFHIVEEGVFKFTMEGEERRDVDAVTKYFRAWKAETGEKAGLNFMDDVTTLHDGNWDMVWELSEENPVLLNVYASWCAHCKDIAPTFAKLAEVSEDYDRPWTLVKLDGSKFKEAARQLSISQYPTLYIFHEKKAYRYTGGHGEREMANYMRLWKPRSFNEVDLRVDEFTDVREEDVLDLSDDTFGFAVEEYKTICAFFYAPWCGHCKKLHPIFDKAASYLVDKDVPVQMVRVDATENPDLVWKYNISAYPFVTVIDDGKPYMFRGKRSANGITNYLRYWEAHDTEVLSMNEEKVKKLGGSNRRSNNRRVKKVETASPEPMVEMINDEL